MLIGSERVPEQKNRAIDPHYKLLSYGSNKYIKINFVRIPNCTEDLNKDFMSS